MCLTFLVLVKGKELSTLKAIYLNLNYRLPWGEKINHIYKFFKIEVYISFQQSKPADHYRYLRYKFLKYKN